MAHSHRKTNQNLTLAVVLNLAFFAVELFFGNLFNSKMIIADAIHDLGDAITLAGSLVINKISHRKTTAKYSYGFRRIVIFGAILNSAVILVGSWQIANALIYEFFATHEHGYVNARGILLLSIGGIVVNLIAAWRVYGAKGVLERSVFVHLLEDVLGWVLTFLTSILMWWTGYHWLDRVMSLVVLLIVCWSVFGNLRQIFKLIMVATPSEAEFSKIEKQISKIEGVQKIEKAHYWSLDGEQNIFTARIFIAKGFSKNRIRTSISRILANFSVIDSTIELIEK
ncbi:MAG: cation diffusion facilitator family transporter [bacterium]|nr:cation diffusion facilitator family transporter [bacterium]